MAFDLSTARPVSSGTGGGFDLSTAKPYQQEQPKKQIGVYGAQLNAESGGKDFDDKGELLRSKKGALGSRQVLLSTALDPGLPGVTPIDRTVLKTGDKQAIAKELNRVGDEYMEALRKRYNGNEELALAAYNAGFGAVDKAGGKIPNIPETLAYVEKITGKKPAGISAQPYKPEPTGPTLDDYSFSPGVDASMVTNKPLVDFGSGMVRGAGSIGSTILSPYDAAKDYFAGRDLLHSNKQRRSDIDTGLQELTGADPDSMAYGAGKLGAEVAGTWGMGGLLAKGASSIPGVARYVPWLVDSIKSGGMNAGGVQGARGLLVRGVGGAATGAASAGAVDPEYAKTGAMLGGGLPIAAQAAGKTAYGLGRALTGGPASQEVVDLAGKASQLGIDIPADRLANSRPMNALASTLNYVPFSGRAGTERLLKDQVKTAVARSFGQDTPNITQGLRRAQQQLGGEFERVLTSNRVVMDQAFLDDLANLEQMATKELEGPQAQIIKNQIDELISKVSDAGDIDGKAAYVVKRTLDKIGRRNSPEASYAIDLKRRLMEALNRSLGPDEAAQFANVRKMYGNMSEIEKIAQNGADGDISMARLANLRNVNNQELQDLADIAATFVKDREGQHGAMQRFVLAALSANNPALLGSMMAAGRGANTVLNSQAAKRAALSGLNVNPDAIGNAIEGGLPLMYRLSGANAQ
jgi:hypothetical protein